MNPTACPEPSGPLLRPKTAKKLSFQGKQAPADPGGPPALTISHGLGFIILVAGRGLTTVAGYASSSSKLEHANLKRNSSTANNLNQLQRVIPKSLGPVGMT